MPLYRALSVLIVIALGFWVWTSVGGVGLEGRETMMMHFKLGIVTAILTCFIHVLALFYFIGTGKDIRDAVEGHAELRERFVPWTRLQKRRVFPPACLAITLVIVATLLGGEVHSRVLGAGGGVALPFREVPGWWVHLVVVACALVVNLYAFVREFLAVRENRRGIEAINRALGG